MVDFIKRVLFQYVGSLFMEQAPNGTNVMSLGRVSLAALLGQCMWQWRMLDRDIVPGMQQTLFALLAYNFGSKGIQTVKDGITAWQETKAMIAAPATASAPLGDSAGGQAVGPGVTPPPVAP